MCHPTPTGSAWLRISTDGNAAVDCRECLATKQDRSKGSPPTSFEVAFTTEMTKLTPDEPCITCGSLLVPPELASGFKLPDGTDYVCLRCGQHYRWTNGNPPRLTTITPVDKDGKK